jgi:endonuclease/exonuclease/phosphatase (EEP) superfamily protein YafD
MQFPIRRTELFISLVVLLFGLIIVSPFYNFTINLIKSFGVQAMGAIGVLGLIFLITKRWIVASSSLLSATIIFFHLIPHIGGISTTSILSSKGTKIKVAHFNVLINNTGYDKTIGAVKSLNPDFVSFQEVSRRWGKELENGLKKEYPFYKIISSDTNSYGIAYFSRLPVENPDIILITNKPNLTGDIVVANEKIHFITSHTKSPLSRERYWERNEHIKGISEYLKNIPGPKLAIGDYNAVPWHPHIINLKKATGLNDSRKKLTPTYPSHFKLARIPIDYIFYSDELTCLSFESVKSTTSDHFGVFGQYKF